MDISIVVCPNCRQVQGCYSKKVFQCKICGKTCKMGSLKIFKKTRDPSKAREEILKLKIKLKMV